MHEINIRGLKCTVWNNAGWNDYILQEKKSETILE